MSAADQPEPRRWARRHTEQDPTVLPGLVVPVTVVSAALVALGASAGYAVSVVVLAVLALVLAVGWPMLLECPSPAGVRWILVLGALLVTGALAVTDGPDRLRWLPVVVAIGLIAAFVQQLLRKDGRDRLTAGVAATSSGLAVMASGATMVPMSLRPTGPDLVHVAMAALAAGALVGLTARRRRVGSRAILVVLVAGGVTAWVVATWVDMRVTTALGVGILVASVSYSVRHVLGALPGREDAFAQAASAAASVLLPGVVVLAMGALAGI